MKKINLLILIMLIPSISVSAQNADIEPIIVRGNIYSGCEENAATFDNLANILRSSDERLFIVVRLGRGEVSRELNRRRLHNVRTYFKDGWPNIDAGRFVFAEGDRIDDVGRVEFYVGSRLLLISLVRRRGDICVDCCDFPDPRYYGYGRRESRRRNRR
jgi:hypothetical protein